jgi:DnaJ-class molecular chaperone
MGYRVYSQLEDHIVKCDDCDGTGQSNKVECDTCFGSGERELNADTFAADTGNEAVGIA